MECKAEFFYKTKVSIGRGASTKQEYGDGTLSIDDKSLSFKPFKEPKIKGGIKGGMLKSLASTNVKLYPHPVLQYRDIIEIKADKKKMLSIVLHQPYSVNPLTGQEMLAIPAFETEMILYLKFSDNETRDSIMSQIDEKFKPFRRSVAEVGYGAQSPSQQPITATGTASGEAAGYCKNCGEPFTTGQKFCGKCGNGLP